MTDLALRMTDRVQKSEVLCRLLRVPWGGVRETPGVPPTPFVILIATVILSATKDLKSAGVRETAGVPATSFVILSATKDLKSAGVRETAGVPATVPLIPLLHPHR